MLCRLYRGLTFANKLKSQLRLIWAQRCYHLFIHSFSVDFQSAMDGANDWNRTINGVKCNRFSSLLINFIFLHLPGICSLVQNSAPENYTLSFAFNAYISEPFREESLYFYLYFLWISNDYYYWFFLFSLSLRPFRPPKIYCVFNNVLLILFCFFPSSFPMWTSTKNVNIKWIENVKLAKEKIAFYVFIKYSQRANDMDTLGWPTTSSSSSAKSIKKSIISETWWRQ